ncbi:MAG: radical SAM protein [Candidatus Aenigmatarchaeota archaeon]
MKIDKNNILNLSAPLVLVVEVTNICNLNCKYCYNSFKRDKIRVMSFGDFSNIVEQATELNVFDINISGGEPFVHPQILDFIKLVLDKELGISIVSNGTVIDKNMAKELAKLGVTQYIQVSFDSHVESINDLTRQGFKESFEGFLNLVANSDNRSTAPSIGIVLNRFNYESIVDTIDFFSNFTDRFHIMNVMNSKDFSLEPQHMEDFLNIILPQLKQLSDEKNLKITIFPHEKSLHIQKHFDVVKIGGDKCLAGLTTLVIDSELNVYPCDIVNKIIGNLKRDTSLAQIYKVSKETWAKLNGTWCKK